MTRGQRIFKERRRRNVTAQQLAETIDISVMTLRNVEAGMTAAPPTTERLLRWLDEEVILRRAS